MKKLFPALLFLAFVSSIGFGQTPTVTPKSVETTEEVVKISTALVQVDVTVTDKNGKIITDLKPEDFEIFVNNEKQEITNFSFSSPLPKDSTSSKNSAGTSAPTAPLRREQVRRTIALMVDDLTLQIENVSFVRKSLRKFVDEQMQGGDLVTIIRTGGSTGTLQQFTSNRQQLYRAIEKIRWNPIAEKRFDPNTPQASGIGGGTGLRDPEQERLNYRQSIIAAATINSVNYVVSGMKNLPGRKSVVLFSEGFRLLTSDLLGKEKNFRVHEALEKLVDSASRASVVVSTIDARGLEPVSDSDVLDQQDGLTYLAKQTGGLPIKNGNDFNLGIEKILDEQEGYYLVGYTPDADTFDPAKQRFNKFTVKVKRGGARVRYRSGFFAASNAENQKPVVQSPNEPLTAALNSPFAVNGIALSLSTLFGNDAQQGSFVRSLLHINAGDLKFTDEADGSKKAVFDVLAVSFNDNGTPVDKIFKSYTLAFPAKEYQKFLVEGFVYYFTLPIKEAGAYQFRVAIRDKQSEKVGSASQFIEIPNLKKEEITLSGVVLENLTIEQWQKEGQSSLNKVNAPIIADQSVTNPMTDTSLRRFKAGTILRYGFEVYNAKFAAAQKPRLTAQARILRDGKILFEGRPSPFELAGQSDWQKIMTYGALVLGREMQPGDYVLQIIVTDNLAKEKRKFATQFVQFEILE